MQDKLVVMVAFSVTVGVCGGTVIVIKGTYELV